MWVSSLDLPTSMPAATIEDEKVIPALLSDPVQGLTQPSVRGKRELLQRADPPS